MTITPDILAELIYACSELRYFEKECLMNPNQEAHDIVIKIQFKVDQLLIKMGMVEFIPLSDLKNLTKIALNGKEIPAK